MLSDISWDVQAQTYPPYQGTAANHFGSVLSASEPIWSHMHVGLSLFVYRLLHKIWDSALLQVVDSGGKSNWKAAPQVSGVVAVELALPPDTIAALEAMMRGLVAVVNHVLERLQVRLILFPVELYENRFSSELNSRLHR